MWAVPYSKTPFQVKLPETLGFRSSPWETTDCPINLPIPVLLVTWQEIGKKQKANEKWLYPRESLISASFFPLPFLPSFQSSGIIVNLRRGISGSFTSIYLLLFYLTVCRNWRQIKAGTMKRVLLDWGWHHLSFNPDLDVDYLWDLGRSPFLS